MGSEHEGKGASGDVVRSETFQYLSFMTPLAKAAPPLSYEHSKSFALPSRISANARSDCTSGSLQIFFGVRAVMLIEL